MSSRSVRLTELPVPRWTTPEEPNPEEASCEKPGPEVPPTVRGEHVEEER